MAEQKRRTVTIHVSRDTRRALRLLAALTGKTMEEAAETAIRKDLERVQKEQE